MEDFNKIIDSLHVKFFNGSHLEITRPVTVENYLDVQNTLILVNRGYVTFGEENEEVNEGELLFIPSNKITSLKYGTGYATSITKENLDTSPKKFFKTKDINPVSENIIILKFEAKIFESVNFFHSTDIPAFKISDELILVSGMREIASEMEANNVGKSKMIKINTQRIVINIIRHILDNNLFTEQLSTNINYFKDPRLLDIFNYIKENLAGDLTNKTLSNVANVSEDYVGQYFKLLTGITPQDYIEYQRMERAVELLRSTKKSINEITAEVGFNSSAYFCRRFKMMFGISAGKMRKKDEIPPH